MEPFFIAKKTAKINCARLREVNSEESEGGSEMKMDWKASSRIFQAPLQHCELG